MTGAYFVHDDNYRAMKEERDKCNGQKKAIQEFNSYQEQKLAEVEDEEILSTFSSAPPTTKIILVQKQQEDSD